MSTVYLSEQVEGALRVLAAAQAHEIVRREIIGVQRRWQRAQGAAEAQNRRSLEQQLHALRDRDADLLQIITEQEF